MRHLCNLHLLHTGTPSPACAICVICTSCPEVPHRHASSAPLQSLRRSYLLLPTIKVSPSHRLATAFAGASRPRASPPTAPASWLAGGSLRSDARASFHCGNLGLICCTTASCSGGRLLGTSMASKVVPVVLSEASASAATCPRSALVITPLTPCWLPWMMAMLKSSGLGSFHGLGGGE